MRINWEYISPEAAKEMLKNKYINRDIRNRRLDVLVNAIKSGTFKQDSPNTISIDVNGRLIDGQHRLTAIVKTGVGFNLLVARDVPNDVIIDRGLPRSIADSLYMRGAVSPVYCEAKYIAIIRHYIMCQNNYSTYDSITDEMISNFIEKHGDLVVLSYRISNKGADHTITRKTTIQAAILGALLCGVDQEMLEKFTYCVNSGFISGPSETSAVVLRNDLLKNKPSSSFPSRINLTMKAECAIRDFINGTPRRNVYSNVEHVYIRKELI